MKRTRTPDNTKNGKIKMQIKQRLMDFKRLRCRVNFSGYLELEHASYVGDIEEQDWNIVEEWLLYLDCWNGAIVANK